MSTAPSPTRRLWATTLALLIAAVPAIAQTQKESKPPTPAKPVLYKLKLKGPYMDLPESSFDLSSLLGGGAGQPKSFYTLLENLAAAKGSGNFLLLDLSSASVGLNLPQLKEFERTMQRIKATGVKTVAWMPFAESRAYQVACLCDEIYMADMGMIDMAAPAMENMFLKDVFDLIGIKTTAVRCGEFKGAVEPYTRSSMSKHLREHYRAMLASFNDDLVRRIARGRGLSTQKVREMQGKRIFHASLALSEGLIDGITPFDNAMDGFKRFHTMDFKVKTIAVKKKKMDLSNPFTLMAQIFKGPRRQRLKGDHVVVLHLSGTIVDGEKDAAGSIVSGPSARLIDKLAANKDVKGVVLRINSPGGSATASERILLAIRRLARTKPVAVSMGSLAASGGYYIACLPGSTIYAEPTTLTGSIGVFGLMMNFKTLARRVGMNLEVVSLDPTANWGNPFEEPDEEFLAFMQKHVNRTYNRFLSHVTLARRIPRAKLLELAGGRVWSGAQAFKAGLVDKLGGLDAAIAEVAVKAGLKTGAYKTRHLPTPRNPLSLLAEGLQGKSVLAELPAPVRAFLALRRELVEVPLSVMIDGLRGRPTPRVWALSPMGIRIR